MITKPDIEVRYEDEKSYRDTHQDSAFYTLDAQAHQIVATVLCGTREVRVFCDGEMRIHLWESKEARDRGDHYEVIRYCDRLIEAGITNDKELAKAQEEERLEWVNNSWFDLYAYDEGFDGKHLDAVSHEVETAVLQACELIEDDEYWSTLK